MKYLILNIIYILIANSISTAFEEKYENCFFPKPIKVDRCQLPMVVGPCRAPIPSYFYNSQSGKCEKFVYGGCDGNANRFLTYELCEKICNNKVVDSNEDAALDKCQQPAEQGQCKARIPKYFYNSENGKCELFFYGGCGGNDNRFDTYELCEKICNNQVVDSDEEVAVNRCQQPLKVGPCRDFIVTYFYNSISGKCEELFYGGCGGNDNRFETYELCEEICNKQLIDSDKDVAVDRCQQPMKVGPCRAAIPSYFYNSKNGKCEKFFYGGCRGNDNRFDTYELCEKICNNQVVDSDQDAALDKCQQPVEQGQCKARFPKYFYNSENGKCELFFYGGCGGNDNRFDTYESCEKICNNKVVDSDQDAALDKCQQPVEQGQCKARFPKYFYNSENGKCELFFYGGCGGNDNRFDTYELCEEICNKQLTDSDKDVAVDRCQQPKLTGPCRDFSPKYFYNPEKEDCEEFIYGGCGGNENKFDTYELCEYTCKDQVNQNYELAKCMCFQPPELGPGTDYVKRYFYNPKSKSCEGFIYGGSKGNDNRFDTSQLCEYVCSNQDKNTKRLVVDSDKDVDRCHQPKKTGPCLAAFYNYFYNPEIGECEEFIYGGCGGNDNRFETYELCENTCKDQASQINELAPCKCYQPPDEGPGKNYVQRYFYNPKANKCQEFIYGGYGGNDNRFETFELCQYVCSNQDNDNSLLVVDSDADVDKCYQPKQTGPCLAAYYNYFYNPEIGECEEFIYGGCGGNDNRFETYELCENTCKDQASQLNELAPCKCYQPPDEGPGKNYEQRYFYNPKANKCQEFIYGGYGGNDNRFETFELCQYVCSNQNNNETILTDNSNSDSSSYSDSYSDSYSVSFSDSDPDFDSDSESETSNEVVSDRCYQPRERGRCLAAFYNYFYNPKTNECEEFIYGGCEGNDNRFRTYKLCKSTCIKKDSKKPSKKTKNCCDSESDENHFISSIFKNMF